MSFFILFYLISLSGLVVIQTCIIVRKTSEEIYVGADSKRTFTTFATEGNDSKETSQSVCKISYVGDTFFAISGFGGLTIEGLIDNSVPLPILAQHGQDSLRQIVIESLKSGGTLIQKAKNFKENSREPFIEILEIIKQKNPAYYERRFVNTEACSVVFFGMEKNITTLAVVSIEAVNSISEPASIRYKLVNSNLYSVDTNITISLGEHKAITALKSDENFWKIGVVKAINELIKLQAEATPEKVGLPVDIIKIDKNGRKWIQKNFEHLDL